MLESRVCRQAAMLLLATGLAAAVTVTAVLADRIMVGNSYGEVIGRDEYDLATHIPSSYANWGYRINSLASGVDGDLFVGLQLRNWWNVDVRKFDNLGAVIRHQCGLGEPCTAIAAFPNGDVALGAGDSRVYVRDKLDMWYRPSWYTGSTDGIVFNNAAITALAMLPEDRLAIANAGGEVFLRSGADLTANAPGADTPYINYAIPVNALAVLPDGKLAIALDDGTIDVRLWTDLATSLTSVSFGAEAAPKALAALPNGELAIGLGDGSVHIRHPADLTQVVRSLQFTTGADQYVSALAVTSNGNLVIGTSENLVFVRRPGDLTLTPEGFWGLDGLNYSYPISAIACVPAEGGGPEISTIAEVKAAQDGAVVTLPVSVATAAFQDWTGRAGFAIEAPDRSSGIRIVSTAPVNPGNLVAVRGTVATISGEKVVQAPTSQVVIGSPNNPFPDPLFVTNLGSGGGAFGGQGAVVDDAGAGKMSVGANSVGLLMTIFGKVTTSFDTYDWSGYFYIDDGSGLNDGSGNTGIKCRPIADEYGLVESLPYEGEYVAVTGVMGVQQINGINARYFWTQSVSLVEP